MFDNNTVDKTLRISLRWGIIFEPICWLRSHDTEYVFGASAFDASHELCHRCGKQWF